MKRDYYAGALIAFIGVFMGLNTLNYNIGNLRNIGPGMLPMVLCIILVTLGLLIAINAADPVGEGAHDHLDPTAPKTPDIKGGFAIVIGMLAFVVLTQTLGMVAGTFACVFIAAIGDKDATWLGSFVLASVITVVGVAVFIYGLKMNLPLFQLQGFSL